MSERFNDVGRHEHLETEQERSTDADLVDIGVLLGYRLPQLAISRPYDTDHDDENAEDFDPAPDDADEVIDRRFEALDRVLHLRASHCSRRAAYHHDRLRQLFRSPARPARCCCRGTGCRSKIPQCSGVGAYRRISRMSKTGQFGTFLPEHRATVFASSRSSFFKSDNLARMSSR